MSGDIIDLRKPSGASSDKSSAKRPSAKRYTDEDRQRAIELYKSGKNKSEVSKQLGIPGGTIRGWLKSAVTAGLIQQVSSNENSNSSNSDTDVCLISDGAGEVHGTITKEAVLSNAKSLKDNKTMDDSSPQNFMLHKFFEYMAKSVDISNPSTEMSTADSTSEKRKRDCEESYDTHGKRIKSEAAEPSASWQQTSSSLQALSSMSPTNVHHQQPAAHQGIVKPKPVVSAGFHQQPSPVASSALPGLHPQNATPIPDSSVSYYQQHQNLISFYQQHLIAQQQQEQQQLHNQHQQQRQQQQKQQQQYQQQQHQQHQHYHQNHQQQQPNASYYNHQPQHLVTSNYSSDALQAAPTILSTALSTPKSSGRGRKRAPSAMAQPNVVEQYMQAYQQHLNQLVVQNMLIQSLQQQQINIPPSLQITPVAPLQMQNPTLPLQNPALALHNPALSLQNSGSARSKSRNDTASPRRTARSPLPASYNPQPRGHSPLARVQSPLTGSHSPLPSSTPNSQQQGEHQQGTYEQQQKQQQHQRQPQYENRQQYEEREPVPDSAYQSQDSQSSFVPASQEKPNSAIQVENVDGITCGDGDVAQMLDLTMLSAPTSIMNPLKIKGKRRRKKKVDEVVVCDNLVANAEPADDLHDYLLKQSERIGEEFVESPGLKKNCNESKTFDYKRTQPSEKSVGISLENKENTMTAKRDVRRKRGKRKGKQTGKRTMKKKQSKNVVVKKERVKFEVVDIESTNIELHTIKEESTELQSLLAECQTIISDDNEKKRKRTLNQDEKLKSKFRPNQMVSLCANWLSFFNEDNI